MEFVFNMKGKRLKLPRSVKSSGFVRIIGGLLDLSLPTSDYDADDAALQRQTMKKKKKRKGMRL